MNMLPYILKAAKYEKQKAVPRRCFKGSDDIFDTKSLNLADVSSWLICVINLLLRVVDLFWETNFGFTASLSNPEILHKFAHILRQVEGLYISWNSLKAFHMKPFMWRQNQPWIRIEKQREL